MTTTERGQRRRTTRQRTEPGVVRVRLNDHTGTPRWATAYLNDVTEGGVGISLMTPLPIGSMVIIRGNLDKNRTGVQLQADVKWCTERSDGTYQAGLELAGARSGSARDDWQQTAPPEAEAFSGDPEDLDCYEIMQLNPKADADTIHRVHRILAQRYHPDTPDTGNSEMFIRVTAAAKILSDPEKRAQYDARYRATKQLQWKIFDQTQTTVGFEAERSKRHGILGLLYAKTLHDPERGSMTAVDFEELLGCPREHLQAALWYLRGKGYITRGDNGRYSITVQGFDEAEAHSSLRPTNDLKLLERGAEQEA